MQPPAASPDGSDESRSRQRESPVQGSRPHRSRRWAPLTVAALFTLSGTIHLIRPDIFEALIPGWLPAPTAVVYISGVAELACAYGLVRRRRWAGPASAVLLLALWPGNIQMAVDAITNNGLRSPEAIITLLRLPLQIPLIWMVLQDRDPAGHTSTAHEVGPLEPQGNNTSLPRT